ncbi:MAG: hypothetical protein IT364_24545 [Candidatus Hydrogenedentes bacterium]|nr:hypothetical protein [Candidatus Hydrogenedentota bacterium]
MRSTAVATFFDRCRVGTWAGAKKATGPEPEDPAEYSYGNALSCGFDAGSSDESDDGPQSTLTSATIRFPLGTVIAGQDRIMLTQRTGEALAIPEYYAVIGEPRRGQTALVCNVERLTDERSVK